MADNQIVGVVDPVIRPTFTWHVLRAVTCPYVTFCVSFYDVTAGCVVVNCTARFVVRLVGDAVNDEVVVGRFGVAEYGYCHSRYDHDGCGDE
jgi:hypothetical protein